MPLWALLDPGACPEWCLDDDRSWARGGRTEGSNVGGRSFHHLHLPSFHRIILGWGHRLEASPSSFWLESPSSWRMIPDWDDDEVLEKVSSASQKQLSMQAALSTIFIFLLFICLILWLRPQAGSDDMVQKVPPLVSRILELRPVWSLWQPPSSLRTMSP